MVPTSEAAPGEVDAVVTIEEHEVRQQNHAAACHGMDCAMCCITCHPTPVSADRTGTTGGNNSAGGGVAGLREEAADRRDA